MIPLSTLLPPLPVKDQQALNKLTSDYESSKARVTAYGNDARVARKKELRQKLRTAQGDEMLAIGAELQTISQAFMHARRGAKQQLRALNSRYSELFSRLIDRAEAHADKLIEQAKKAYDTHFAAFGAQPVGQSPVVEFLIRWKAELGMKRNGLVIFAQDNATPLHPREILPYAAEATTDGIL